MRVVAGTAKGRRLKAPPGGATRPTSDRVREAMFNSLGSHLGVDGLVGAAVLDLFAGSGALGIEALSRGAAHATFVEDDARTVGVIRENLDALGFAERATVVRRDAFAFVTTWAPARVEGARTTIILADPPYSFTRWPELLERVAEVAPGAVAVLESDREITPGAGWRVLGVKHHGGSVVTLARSG